jgi:uncharacterized membrane protein YsdA (DUF1294 family)/cold shock CspA family protein
MRYQGRITTWKDEQGYGFITPNGGGAPVFVHVKSFSNRERRPLGNEIVTYELTADERRRPRAINISFVEERRIERKSPGNEWGTLIFVTLYLIFVAGAVVVGRLPALVLGIYFGASVVAFVAYAIDKSAAERGAWRIHEGTLHLFGLVGGWPGALLAQKGFRHKTRKREFRTVYWATVVLNCVAVAVYSFKSA